VAALDCAEADAEVTLIEVRPRLGGAAYSFERDGLWLDNGQHVFLRCCTAYIALLERLGSGGRVRVQPRLEIPVLGPRGKRAVLRRGGMPAPLHLAGTLARYPHLTLGEKAKVVRAALALRRLGSDESVERERVDGTTLGEWLAEHGQSERAVGALWNLIALPTLNLPAAQGSLALGAFVLQTGLLKRRDAGDIGFHMRPLSETLGEPALEAMREAGVELRLGVRAQRVEREGSGLRVSADGGEIEADAVVCAVPHTRAAALLGPLLGEEAARWEGLGESPIVNVHVVYDRRVCDVGFAAGVGTPVQYVFDRTEAVGIGYGQCLAISLSGAEREMGMDGTALRECYLEALGELFPRAGEAVVRGVYVSREHAATFRAAPGSSALRPKARTSVPGLVLAGAWTDTGWPATLEGAVLSGHAAAHEVMAA
jgi:squalene-associated FAD-dependent desaturase